ncbi:PHP domain-containing protein [Aurantibacter crassamenti]|uniref:PHP domain-containing protein n=1 Tax=Aurantibacter crassamenti TaxID=1837375 RepID=UPI00193A39F2|nr:PHP domain-containing protein [Aurantibacter crassamenti]MBM1105116.1 PHP domain-containing protein [Aurantibacter crassamenti]
MNKISIHKITLLILILLIIILATAFHFQIHFENALTLQPELDFEVKIAFWRVLFEPIVGLLLFFNRSLYALEEIPIALLWLVIVYCIYSVFRIIKSSHGRILALKKLANLPLVIGVCFALFVLVLFIPLPNNTIINNSENSILVTTHAHTEYSHDGLISQENMLQWHKRNGFDAFFITDHANHKKSLQFAQDQNINAQTNDPLVMVGQEHSGSNHMSLLGLNGKFDTKGMTDKAVIDSVHRYGGAVIINHWFDGKGKEKEFYHEIGVDGFEIENSGTDLYYDRETFEELRNFCEENELTMIGGLDFHGYGRVCSMYNALKIDNWNSLDKNTKEQSILSVLKSGSNENIKVLIYKDRPYYSKANLFISPLFTVVNYFRSLNLLQVFSWIGWLVLLQNIVKRFKRKEENKSTGLLIIAITSALFMIALAAYYYNRGQLVLGYSKVYKEYSELLGPIGIVLLIYAAVVLYFRFFKQKI